MAYIREYQKYNNTHPDGINEFVVHTLAEGYLNSLLEPVIHCLCLEEALEHCKVICVFYTQGWLALLNS